MRAGIRKKLSATLLGVALVPIGVLGVYGVHRTMEALREMALEAAGRAATMKAHMVEDFLQATQEDMLFLSLISPLQHLADALGAHDTLEVARWQEEVGNILATFSQQRKVYRKLIFLDNQGRGLVQVYSDGRQAWLIRGVVDSTLEVPGPLEYKVEISDSRRRKQGQLVASLFPGEILDRVQEGGLEWGEGVALVHPNGEYLARMGMGFNGQRLREDLPELVARKVLSGEAGVASGVQKDIVSYAPVLLFPSSGRLDAGYWVLVERRPKRMVFASVRAYRRMLLVLGIGAGGLALVLSILLSRMLTRPLMALRDGALRLGDGSLDHRLAVRTGDEIEEVADAFNHMAEQLQELYRDLEKKVREKTRELERAYRELAQSEKLAALGTLAAGVAHEINNPLDGIQGCIARIRRRPEDSEQTLAYLDLIEEGLERISRVVGQLLDLSQKRELSLALTDLNRVLEDTLALAEYQLRKGGVEVVRELDPDLPKVLGDGQYLGQVFLNLFLNALAAMPEGGMLTVRTFPRDGWACIEVRDTGVGIPEEDLGKIFDPFYSNRPSGGGTGLGLSVSYAIVQEHGGTIEVESAPGKGATFRVVLRAI